MTNEKYTAIFEEERFYHVYSRSNNGESIFSNDENYRYFLQQFDKYLSNFLTVYAYCLLNNHVHFLVKIKEINKNEIFAERVNTLVKEFEREKKVDKNVVNEAVSGQFRNFFISYAMSFNKQEGRTGNLFHRPFKRILIDNDSYFSTSIAYIHCNPNKHKIGDFESYKWSSYQRILHPAQTKLAKKEVIDWFGDVESYKKFHKDYSDDLLDRDFWLEE